MTECGGHVYELGVGRVPVTSGQRPATDAMQQLFHHESTRFIGHSDREDVVRGYLETRANLEAFDSANTAEMVRNADRLLTAQAHEWHPLVDMLPCVRTPIWFLRLFVAALIFVSPCFLFYLFLDSYLRRGRLDDLGVGIVFSIYCVFGFAALFLGPSRIFRAHLAACLPAKLLRSVIRFGLCLLYTSPSPRD